MMLNKSRLSDEGFSTFTALIGPLSSVNPLVLCELERMFEGFSTFFALRRIFSSVNLLVLHEV